MDEQAMKRRIRELERAQDKQRVMLAALLIASAVNRPRRRKSVWEKAIDLDWL